jgi:2,3-bisphosphoglycerate-independent phosphoglycerate mutase
MEHSKIYNPIVLCILDGWGVADNSEFNAISKADIPFWRSALKNYPSCLIETSGPAVGLPHGQMGNSEVGHMTIGSGRVIMQDLPRIDQAIATGTIAENEALNKLVILLKENNKSCHLAGLISDGGVHSHINHIIFLAKFLSKNQIPTYLHCFLDGRDTAPTSAKKFVNQLINEFAGDPLVTIATICGRYYAMDRDNRWERTEQCYNAIIEAKGNLSSNLIDSIQENYDNNISDEFILPIVYDQYKGTLDGDAFIMGNFRADRVRQLIYSLENDFISFKRNKLPNFSKAVGMVEYSSLLNDFIEPIFKNETLTNTLPEIIANHNLTQLRIAETEKYAHITFFFNGGKEEKYPGEERILVPSAKVATYDLKPEMSAFEITNKLEQAIISENYNIIIVNYANTDMVGHTGNFDATIKAAEVVNQCLEKIVNMVSKLNGVTLITADHGNAEQMIDPLTKEKFTAHTKNPVPLVLINDELKNIKLNNGTLCDISPTILELMNIKKPKEMTGVSLIKNGINNA